MIRNLLTLCGIEPHRPRYLKAKLAAALTIFAVSLTGLTAVGTAQAGAQTCVDLGWKQSNHHVYHGVRCGNHDTWDYYGPQGQYGGQAFHYWWPGDLTMWQAAPLVYWNPSFNYYGFSVKMRRNNAPVTQWQSGNAAPGYTHKLWSSTHGYAGDLQILIPGAVHAVNVYDEDCSCQFAAIATI